MTENTTPAIHTIMIENQSKASLTGILTVESFNERQVHVKTATTSLVICGETLNVSKFNTENGTLVVEGKITEIKYNEGVKAAGVIKRLFK